MSDRDDPTRWAHGAADAPTDFDGLLRADEQVGPSAPRLARMLERVRASVSAPPLSGIWDSTGAPTPGIVPKALAALLFSAVAVLCVAGAILLRREPPARVPPARNVAPLATPSQQPASGASGATAPVAQPKSQAPAAAPSAEATPAAVPAARADGALDARPAVRALPGRGEPARATVAASEDPVAELSLLERAQRVLRSEPAAALALAQEHRARFERGTLAQEREMLAIEALLRLERRAQAERRARAFTQRYPQSSHGPRLRDLLRSGP